MLPNNIRSDATIYNVFEDESGALHYQPTILRGVFLRADYGADLTEKGIATSDRISVMIPRAIAVAGREYMPPFDFLKIPFDRKPFFWTIAKEDKIVNQAVDGFIQKASELTRLYGHGHVFTVTNIEDNNFGPQHMRHFVVTGR